MPSTLGFGPSILQHLACRWLVYPVAFISGVTADEMASAATRSFQQILLYSHLSHRRWVAGLISPPRDAEC